MPFQRDSPALPTQDGLYIIRGSGQVGKNSWLKTILSHYAKDAECFYLSCENISDFKELAEILKTVRHCNVVLLNEINFVEGWDRAITHAYWLLLDRIRLTYVGAPIVLPISLQTLAKKTEYCLSRYSSRIYRGSRVLLCTSHSFLH